MTTHTLLSPSSSSRWLRCPDSVRVNQETEERKPKEGEKDYAGEGTAAHAVLELCLRIGNDPSEYIGMDMHEGHVCTEAMAEAVETALEYVYTWMADHPKGEFHPEERVHWGWLCKLDPEISSGTADAMLIDEEEIVVIDYKHGAGISVEAQDNTQLQLYGMGALKDRPKVKRLRLVIVQPRSRHVDGPVREFDISRKDLEQWIRRTVAPAAHRVVSGDRHREAGDHCRFCKVQGNCRALKDHAMTQAQTAFDPIEEVDPEALTDDEVADCLQHLDAIESWCKALHAEALSRMLKPGGTLPGYKLVIGRAPPRHWVDEKKVMQAAQKAKINVDAYMPRSLVSPAQMEKLPLHKGKLGKALFRKVFNKLTSRKDAAPHIAREDDPRAEFIRGSEFEPIDPVQ